MFERNSVRTKFARSNERKIICLIAGTHWRGLVDFILIGEQPRWTRLQNVATHTLQKQQFQQSILIIVVTSGYKTEDFNLFRNLSTVFKKYTCHEPLSTEIIFYSIAALALQQPTNTLNHKYCHVIQIQLYKKQTVSEEKKQPKWPTLAPYICCLLYTSRCV